MTSSTARRPGGAERARGAEEALHLVALVADVDARLAARLGQAKVDRLRALLAELDRALRSP